MKLTATAILLAAAIPAFAQNGPAPYYDTQEPAGEWATVRQVVPMVEQVSAPQRVCQQGSATVAQPQGSMMGGALGAVAGGVLGNQVGHGRGRAAATVVGAVVGANLGYATGPQDSVVTQVPTTQCQMVSSYSQRTTGYRVTYTYAGHTYEAVMASPPQGNRIRVAVSVTPVDGGYSSQPMAPQSYGPAPAYAPPPPAYPPMSQAQPEPQSYAMASGGFRTVAYQQQPSMVLSVSVGDSGHHGSNRGAYSSGYQQGFRSDAMLIASSGEHHRY